MNAEVLGSLNVHDAMIAEASNPPFLLASRTVDEAIQDLNHQALTLDSAASSTLSRLAEYCTGQYRRGLDRYPAEVVLASKSTKGRRAIHALSIEQRILYRALVNLLQAPGMDLRRSDSAFQLFQRGPLNSDDYRYLVRTDVVGCYPNLIHESLFDEIVARTGQSLVCDELESFLRSVVGPRGLPQNLGPSHVLAEYYLDVVERAVLRQGIPVWRFSDDFILAASDWSGVNVALDLLAEELRRVGLQIHEEKTRFFRLDTYRDWIAAPQERLEATGAVDFLTFLEEYDPDEPPDDEDRQLALLSSGDVAVEMLERCLDAHRAEGPHDRLDALVNRKIARGALKLLAIIGSPGAVPSIGALLSFEPQLTPPAAYYLRSIAAVHGDAVKSFVSAVVASEDTYLTIWQHSWLVEPFLDRDQNLTDQPITEWLGRLVRSDASGARARAATALAWPNRIEPEEISTLYARSATADRPQLAEAIALRCRTSDAQPVISIAGDSLINSVVIDRALAST